MAGLKRHRHERASSRFLGYTRVSTAEQAHGSSLDDQACAIESVALARGVKVDGIFSDLGVSGSVPLNDRPEGQKLVADLKPGDTVVASKLDRLFRSASDALTTVEALQKRKVGVILADMGPEPVTGNGSAKLFFSMLAAFAEFERGRIAERMADGKAGKAARGGHIGGSAPYGFRIVGQGREAMLEEDEGEREIVETIKTWHAQSSILEVTRRLEQAGILNRVGRPFGETQVRRILERSLGA